MTDDARALKVVQAAGIARADVMRLASELGLDDPEVRQFAERVIGVPWDDCGLVELHRIVDAFSELDKEVAEFFLFAAKLIRTFSVPSSLPLQSEHLDTIADGGRRHPPTRLNEPR